MGSIYTCCVPLSNHFIQKQKGSSPDSSSITLAGWMQRILLCACCQPLGLTSARPLSVCGMLAAIHGNISLTSCWPAALPPHHQRLQETTVGYFVGTLAVCTASLLRKHIQNICSRVSGEREERRRRLMGEQGWWLEGWGAVVVRCRGAGGGAEMRGRQAAKYVCAANLTRTFEKAKSQRESCCLGLLHYKQPELRQAGLSHWRFSTREKYK